MSYGPIIKDEPFLNNQLWEVMVLYHQEQCFFLLDEVVPAALFLHFAIYFVDFIL